MMGSSQKFSILAICVCPFFGTHSRRWRGRNRRGW